MDIHARLRFAHIAPRKVRLVAQMLSGLPVAAAQTRLRYLAPRSAGILLKVLRSAMANAKHNFDLDPQHLVVRQVIVGAGVKLKRSMPRARGSAYRIEKKTSHIDVVLTERTPSAATKKGKTSEVVTRKVEELTPEELAHGSREGHLHADGEQGTGAVRNVDADRGARQRVERHGGDK